MFNKRLSLYTLAVGIIFSFTGCLSDLESEANERIAQQDLQVRNFLEVNNIEATKATVGYHFVKLVSNESGDKINMGDTLGVYYEIETLDGTLIDSYLDETKPPKLFMHTEGGLVPRLINFAANEARVGETLMLYAPAYLAYQDYSFPQLIPPTVNVKVKVTYHSVFNKESLKDFERSIMTNYIAENELEGFEEMEDGLFVKIRTDVESGAREAGTGDAVRFSYQLYQLEMSSPLVQSSQGQDSQITIGIPNNLKFLESGLDGVKEGMEIELLVPSHLGFPVSTQVIPFAIRKDLFERGLIEQLTRPFEPFRFVFQVKQIV